MAAEAKAARAAAERAVSDGFAALLEEALTTERRVAAELEAAAAAAAEDARAAALEAAAARRAAREEGEEGSGGDADADESSRLPPAPRPPRSPGSIPEEELEGLSYDQLERYWGGDERWGAAGAAARREMFAARFGAAIAAGAARKEVCVEGARGGGRGGFCWSRVWGVEGLSQAVRVRGRASPG